jgi:ferredoxin
VRGYIAHIVKGQYAEALRLIMEKNPLPFSTGQVCGGFCEQECRRTLVDDALAIRELGQFAAHWCMEQNIKPILSSISQTDKKIAVLGGSPAGLTAAYFLRKQGHQVTIFTPENTLGGILQEAGAKDKLLLKMLAYEVNNITALGIEVEKSKLPATNLTLDTVTGLVEQGFSAVYIADELPDALAASVKDIDKVFVTKTTNNLSEVIKEIAAAGKMASKINAYLTNEVINEETENKSFNFSRGQNLSDINQKIYSNTNKMARVKPAMSDTDAIYCEDEAQQEAGRCLSCGCTAIERCDLRKLSIADELDLAVSGMGDTPLTDIDWRHPTIIIDANKCVQCRRCEKSCEYDAIIITKPQKDEEGRLSAIGIEFKENCVSCGKCVDNCSTGALSKKAQTVPVIAEEIKEVRSTCPYCGAGCQIILRVKGQTILEITADSEQEPNFGALCVKGGFGFDFVHDKNRLTKPLIRRDGKLVQVEWDEAYSFAARSLQKLIKDYGADSIAGFSCARATNEENFLMQKFMRTAIGTNNIDHCARL